MADNALADWPTSAPEARALQDRIRPDVRVTPLAGPVHTVAGVDIGFEDGGATTRAAVVVFDATTRKPIDEALTRTPTRMPYVPGLLSFREVPGALAALDELAAPPDLLMVDGHGIAHPKRLGVATHLGLASGLPSIGVAKKRLVGKHEPVPETRLAWTPLYDQRGTTGQRETIGRVLRSREGVKPVFVSPGHRTDFDDALAWCTHFLTRYRLPETTRAADKLASRR